MNKNKKILMVLIIVISALIGIAIDYALKIGAAGYLPAVAGLVIFLKYRRSTKVRRRFSFQQFRILAGIVKPRLRRADGVFISLIALGFIALFFIELFTGERGNGSWSVSAIVYMLSAMLIPPLLEELPVRGVLQGILQRSGFRPWLQVILPAVIFGVAHLFVQQSIDYAIVIGILLGIVRYRTGSIYWTFALHALWNGLFQLLVLLGAV